MKIKKILSLTAVFALVFASASGAVLLNEVKPAHFSYNGVELTASLVEFADVIDSNVFDITGAAWRDGKLYMLHHDGDIDCFVLEGEFLVRDPKAFNGKGTISLGQRMKAMSADDKGWLYVTDGANPRVIIVEPNGTVHTAQDGNNNGSMTVHTSGEWGLRFSSGGRPLMLVDLKKALAGEKSFSTNLPKPIFKKGSETTSFSLPSFLKLNADGTVFIAGLSHKKKGQGFWGVLDKDYNEVFAFLESYPFKDPMSVRNIGSVEDIIPCKYGYALLDGNMRRLHIYDKDYKPIAMLSLKDFFGLNYCWPTTLNRIDDNTVLVTCTQDFPKGSKNVESLVMKVTGL